MCILIEISIKIYFINLAAGNGPKIRNARVKLEGANNQCHTPLRETRRFLTPIVTFDATCVSEIELIIAKTAKTCHLDPMPSKHINDNILSLASVMTDITNASLSEGVMPNQVKHALVHPLLKKPSLCRNTLNNYRPVSNLPSCEQAQYTSVQRVLNRHFPVSLVITPEVIANKINNMKDNKSPGVDGIAPKILKETVEQISKPLAHVFNMSLQEGIVPLEWKEANIIPLFKKGSRNKSVNYRPVSLTSVICKLLESIIRDHIMDFLIKHKLINSSQHGFLKSKSCLTNLLCFL